ncbi:type II secretion system protein [bacterium]|nr:type II secretion system protein [bacterium]
MKESAEEKEISNKTIKPNRVKYNDNELNRKTNPPLNDISCHSELVSKSIKKQTLKQVQGDKEQSCHYEHCFAMRSNPQQVFNEIATSDLRPPRNDGGINNCKELINLSTYLPIHFKKLAFTLSEVLITLGVIGVVAAMTIPNLITNYKAKQLRSQYLKAYSTIQQVFKQMEADDISTDIKPNNQDFYKTFIKYLSGATLCSTGLYDKNKTQKNAAGCYSYRLANEDETITDCYKYADSESCYPDGKFNSGQIMMSDGTLIFFDDAPDYQGWEGVDIYIDINGINGKPNRVCHDFFGFEIVDGIVYPVGDVKTTAYKKDIEGLNSTGWKCSVDARNNSDYFKKIIK